MMLFTQFNYGEDIVRITDRRNHKTTVTTAPMREVVLVAVAGVYLDINSIFIMLEVADSLAYV